MEDFLSNIDFGEPIEFEEIEFEPMEFELEEIEIEPLEFEIEDLGIEPIELWELPTATMPDKWTAHLKPNLDCGSMSHPDNEGNISFVSQGSFSLR